MFLFVFILCICLIESKSKQQPFTIFYDKKSLIEIDYITKDLFGNQSKHNLVLLNRKYITNIYYYYYLQSTSNIINNNVYVISTNSLNYEKTLQVVKFIKPKIIIYLSGIVYSMHSM